MPPSEQMARAVPRLCAALAHALIMMQVRIRAANLFLSKKMRKCGCVSCDFKLRTLVIVMYGFRVA